MSFILSPWQRVWNDGRNEEGVRMHRSVNFYFYVFVLAYHHGATHIYSPVLSQLCACHKHIPNGWQISCWEGHKLQPGQTSLNQTLLQRKLKGKTLNERADLEEEVSTSVFRLFLNKWKWTVSVREVKMLLGLCIYVDTSKILHQCYYIIIYKLLQYL